MEEPARIISFHMLALVFTVAPIKPHRHAVHLLYRQWAHSLLPWVWPYLANEPLLQSIIVFLHSRYQNDVILKADTYMNYTFACMLYWKNIQDAAQY